MLNTIWVSGMGIMLAMLLGFGRTLLLPIGMCMLEAYFSSTSMGPKDCRFLTL